MNLSLNRETAFELEISQDVLAEIHFGGENCCSPEAPCKMAAWHQERIFRIEHGAQAQSTTIVDHLVNLDGAAHARPAAGAPARNQYGTFTVHNATEKQVSYLRHLLATRDQAAINYTFHRTTLDMASKAVAEGTVSLRLASDALDILTGLPILPGTASLMDRATDKQVALITRLATEKDVSGIADFRTTGLSKKDASRLIDALFAAPKAARPAAAVLEVGMYRKADGTMYRAYPAQESRSRILAKRLVADGDEWTFEYAGLASRFVTPAERMTLDEAKAWGAQFGTCCVCARLLTDPTSVAAGIGPICATRI